MNTITYAGSFNRDVYVHRLLFVPLQEFPIIRHFGSYQQSKLRGTGRKGQNSAVKSSQLKVGRQDSTKSGYSTISSLIQSTVIKNATSATTSNSLNHTNSNVGKSVDKSPPNDHPL